MNHRHILPRIALCLILGAIINVAVAWGLLLVPMDSISKLQPNPPRWPTSVPADWPSNVAWSRFSERTGHRSGDAEGGDPVFGGCIGPHHTHYISFRQCGWPMAALQTTRTIIHERDTTRGIARIGGRILPGDPVWTGFTLNTLLYGSFLSLATGSVRKLKQHRRFSRGLCLGCAYDLTGLTTCPECGGHTPSTPAAPKTPLSATAPTPNGPRPARSRPTR